MEIMQTVVFLSGCGVCGTLEFLRVSNRLFPASQTAIDRNTGAGGGSQKFGDFRNVRVVRGDCKSIDRSRLQQSWKGGEQESRKNDGGRLYGGYRKRVYTCWYRYICVPVVISITTHPYRFRLDRAR